MCCCCNNKVITWLHLWSRLVLGFMCCTVFLSMWLSNTSTTAMVMPIAEAVLQQLICTGLADGHDDSETAEGPDDDSGTSARRKRVSFCKTSDVTRQSPMSSTAVSEKEANLEKKELELLYRSERYACGSPPGAL